VWSKFTHHSFIPSPIMTPRHVIAACCSNIRFCGALLSHDHADLFDMPIPSAAERRGECIYLIVPKVVNCLRSLLSVRYWSNLGGKGPTAL
jgi:hypothetical protein